LHRVLASKTIGGEPGGLVVCEHEFDAKHNVSAVIAKKSLTLSIKINLPKLMTDQKRKIKFTAPDIIP
jgi:hypothetical protein